MTLTAEQLAARDGKVTASFAPYLMAGKTDRIHSEWMRLVGHPELVEPDWRAMWNLRYGEIIEPLALDWHEKKTGKTLTRRGEVVVHPELKHVCCTLDAWREDDGFVIDCKAWTSWQKIDYICSFLSPQIIVQRGCTAGNGGSLLIVHGGTEPVEYALTWSADYEASVWERIEEFWQCVLDLTPPAGMPRIAAPVPAVRKQDMTGQNEWAMHAADWLENAAAAKVFATARDSLKALVAPDVVRSYGHGVEIKRNKDGSLRVGKMK